MTFSHKEKFHAININSEGGINAITIIFSRRVRAFVKDAEAATKYQRGKAKNLGKKISMHPKWLDSIKVNKLKLLNFCIHWVDLDTAHTVLA